MLVESLNNSVAIKQDQINNLTDEKRKTEQLLRELELRHRTQANHMTFLEKSNHRLTEKQATMIEELRSLQ